MNKWKSIEDSLGRIEVELAPDRLASVWQRITEQLDVTANKTIKPLSLGMDIKKVTLA